VSTSLEERIARQETAEEVRSLIAAYARAVDEQDPAALAPLFASEMAVTGGEEAIRGRGAAIEFFTGYWASHPARRRHFVTNIAVADLGPSSATATASFLFVSAVGAVSKVGWGTYRARFERDDDGPLRYTAIDMAVEVDVDVRSGWAAELAAAGTGSA
jgi:hypothetical protein